MSFLTEHAADLFLRSEYEITHTSFLSPAEQREIFDALPAARARLVFWGGARGAERRCAFFVPEWALDSICASSAPDDTRLSRASFGGAGGLDGSNAASDDAGDASGDALGFDCAALRSLASFGAFSDEREAAAAFIDSDGSLSGGELAVARIEGSSFASLGHRDFMGAILNLGIKRETLGDLAVSADRVCDAYCTSAAARLIASELAQIGRDAVKVSVRGVLPGERIVRSYTEMTVNVASMRLDCIVAELVPSSREAAKRMIASGAVALEHREETDSDAKVAPGAVISVRGVGKFRVGEVLGETRKGRLRVRVSRYV